MRLSQAGSMDANKSSFEYATCTTSTKNALLSRCMSKALCHKVALTDWGVTHTAKSRASQIIQTALDSYKPTYLMAYGPLTFNQVLINQSCASQIIQTALDSWGYCLPRESSPAKGLVMSLMCWHAEP